MIDAVTGAIKSVSAKLPDSDEYTVVHVKDETVSRGWFPMYTRKLRMAEDTEVIFGEVFWADLSRIRGGTFDLLVGMARLIFGLRYVSDCAADQPGRVAACFLRWLLYLAILVVRGPLLAVLTLGTALCFPAAVHRVGRLLSCPEGYLAWLSDNRCSYAVGGMVIAIGLLIIIIASFLPKFPWKINGGVRTFCIWL
jgi:hypothetical protein